MFENSSLSLSDKAMSTVAQDMEWLPSQQQVTVVATVLWNLGLVGFALNVLLFVKYFQTQWCLLSLPPPAVVVNLCVCNLLQVLGILLAILNLALDLGELGIKAGRIELFLAVFVLVQSWTAQVMMAYCGVFLAEGADWLEWRQPTIDSSSATKRSENHTISTTFSSRQRQNQPHRRHSRLSQTATTGHPSRKTSITSAAEETWARQRPRLSVRQLRLVKWWLVWAWLLSLLAGLAVLVTSLFSGDACFTLDPFRRRYRILSYDIISTRRKEDSMLRIPLLLILVPVYLAGFGLLLRLALRRANSQSYFGFCSCQSAESRAEGRKVKESWFTSILRSSLPFGCGWMKGQMPREETVEMDIERSICNTNVNSVESLQHAHSTENVFNGTKDDLFPHENRNSETDKKRNKNSQLKGKTESAPQALHLHSSCVESLHKEADTDLTNPRTLEQETLLKVQDEWSKCAVSRDDKDALFLPFADVDVETEFTVNSQQSDAKSSVSLTGKSSIGFDDTLDLTLFETDDYVIHFTDIGLDIPVGLEADDGFSRDSFIQQTPRQDSRKSQDSIVHVAHTPAENDASTDPQQDHNLVIVNLGENTVKKDSNDAESDCYNGVVINTKVGSDDGMQPKNDNNSAKKDRPEGKRQRTTTGLHCQEDGAEEGDPDADSCSSVGDSHSLSNRLNEHGTALHLALHSLALSGPSPLTKGPGRERQHGPSSVLDSQSLERATRGPRRMAGSDSSVNALRIVSSSLHHFTVQGRPPPAGHFQLYPCEHKSQFRLPSHPQTQVQQQQLARQSSARSRLSSRLSHHSCRGDPELGHLSRSSYTSNPENEQLNDVNKIKTQRNAPNVRPSFVKQTYDMVQEIEEIDDDDDLHSEGQPSEQRLNSREEIRINTEEAAVKWNHSQSDCTPSDDHERLSAMEQNHQMSLENCFGRLQTPLQCNQQPPRGISGQSVDVQDEQLRRATMVGDYKRSKTKTVRSCGYKEDEILNLNRNGGAGDTNKLTSSAEKTKKRSLQGVCHDGEMSYFVKCLIGLAMHVLLCLPFAVTLAPGLLQEADCGSRVQVLMVARVLFFFHVVLCPLWLLSFHGHAFLKRT